MIVTARQIEEMLKSGTPIVLPYRAKLTPLAQDLIRLKKIEVGYADVDAKIVGAASTGAAPLAPRMQATDSTLLWWCDGPCGPAKAAIMAQARETSLVELPIAQEPMQIVGAITTLAKEVQQNRAAGGILLVRTGAEAMVYANRCPSLRAVLGTCMDAVEQGAQLVAANVLVVEHPYKTLSQVKNLLARFARGKRELSDELRRRLKDLANCS